MIVSHVNYMCHVTHVNWMCHVTHVKLAPTCNHVGWRGYEWVLGPWRRTGVDMPSNCGMSTHILSRHAANWIELWCDTFWVDMQQIEVSWHDTLIWHIVMCHILSRHAANWSVMTWHIDMTHCDVTHFESTCRKLKCHDILICHITYQCTYLNWMCHVSKFEIGTHPETTSFVEAINEYCDRDKKVKATCRKLKVSPVNYMCHHTHVNCMCHVTHVYCVCRVIHVNWMWLGSIRLQVSFAKEAYKRDDILQKRLTILSMLLTVATPYEHVIMNMYEHLLIYSVARGSSIH